MAREKVDVCGLLFDNVTINEAAGIVCDRVKNFDGNSSSSLLLVANQDILNKVGNYKDLVLDDLNSGFLTIPDGYSIVYASKYLGSPLKERVTGPDLMEKMMELSAEMGFSNFFLGAGDGVAKTMADKFKEKYPSLIVNGIYSPPFGDFSDAENSKIIDMINDLKTDIVWVSFGCPKQEWWIARFKNLIKSPVIAGVGAAFDFHSGNKKRAPLFIRKMRLEWFFRIMQEPGRLWKRYFDGGINFIILLKKYKKIIKNKQK